MQSNSLETFISKARQFWSGLNTETVVRMKSALTELTLCPPDEPWLKNLHDEKPATKELYRDPVYGFILLAHHEEKGTSRAPHNHGAGWVFYAVHSGKIQMTSYRQITSATGKVSLVSRGEEVMEQGQCKVFLPGDIHDTKCLTDGFIQFRLTSCDFQEEHKAGRLIRFIDHHTELVGSHD